MRKFGEPYMFGYTFGTQQTVQIWFSQCLIIGKPDARDYYPSLVFTGVA